MRKILLMFVIMAWPISAWAGVTYYVSNANPVGSDSNSGSSPSSPWMTIAKVNESTFQPGDQILFNRGCTWREELTITSSGTSGNPITFGAYGTGSNPLISGADLIAGWTADGQANVWNATVTTKPNVVIFSTTLGTSVATKSALIGNNQWFWASNTLSIYSTSNPGLAYTSPGVQASSRAHAIVSSPNVNYLNIINIDIQASNDPNDGALSFQITSGGINYGLVVNNIVSQWSAGDGILFSAYPDVAQLVDSSISNCAVSFTGRMGINLYQTNASEGRENIIQNNEIIGWGIEGINARGNYSIIQNNYLHDGGQVTIPGGGIHIYSGSSAEGTGSFNIVRYNFVSHSLGSGTDGYGIAVDQWCNNNQIYYNIVSYTDGPGIYGYDAGTLSILNNSVYSPCVNTSGNNALEGGIRLTGSGNHLSTGARIENNICVVLNPKAYAIYVDSDTYPTPHVITNNLWYGPSGGNWYFWNTTGGNSLVAWESICGGHDFNATPLFTNGSGGFSLPTDFILQSGSPAIGAGTNLGLTRDYAGNPVSATPDIGAYQHSTTLLPPTGVRLLR